MFLQNFIELFILDLGENKFRGGIPSWIGTKLLKLRILRIRSNQIHGPIPDELCGLNPLQILDLACNNLSGPIPKCFNNFNAMATRTLPDEYYFSRENTFGEVTEDALVVVKGIMVEYDIKFFGM